MTQRLSKLRAFASRLRSDTSGLALTEFAFAMPILLSMGMLGIEVSNLALTHMKVSQAALNLADNISRVGEAHCRSRSFTNPT
jgi:Flp pilus assembly protein TadG